MAVLLGLLVAASYGSADFLGGIASRGASTLTVLVWAQVVACAGAVIVAFSVGGPVTLHPVVLGAIAGLLNVAALGCLYRGLATGQIGQVAPIAALIGAVVPVGWGLLTGERPEPLELCGVALALVAGALVSSERQERSGRLLGTPLVLALGAGLGFGISFILFAGASHGSGFWPVLASTGAAVVGVAGSLVVTRTSFRLPHAARVPAVGAGVLEVAAGTMLLISVRHGLIAVVAPIVSLAPGFTVMHAWWYLHERASRFQVAGLALAILGMMLIAVA